MMEFDMTKERSAALAGNRAIKELARSLEIRGLSPMVADRFAANAVNDAQTRVDSIVESLIAR
jgi:hypothetical protein